MKAALGQFAVSREWQENLSTSVRLMGEAKAAGADLLLLPEGILARDITDPDIVLKTAQPLDGPFMQGVLCLLYTSPSPRDGLLSRMPSSA